MFRRVISNVASNRLTSKFAANLCHSRSRTFESDTQASLAQWLRDHNICVVISDGAFKKNRGGAGLLYLDPKTERVIVRTFEVKKSSASEIIAKTNSLQYAAKHAAGTGMHLVVLNDSESTVEVLKKIVLTKGESTIERILHWKPKDQIKDLYELWFWESYEELKREFESITFLACADSRIVTFSDHMAKWSIASTPKEVDGRIEEVPNVGKGGNIDLESLVMYQSGLLGGKSKRNDFLKHLHKAREHLLLEEC